MTLDANAYNATQPVTVSRRYPAAPLVGVAAVVIGHDGRALLVKRGRPPRAGTWGLPGGLLDLGERLADGAHREVMEETGIEADIRDVIGTFEPLERDHDGRIEYHYVVIDFWAAYVSGEPHAHDDADEVAWVALTELDGYDLNPETRDVIESAHAAWQSAAASGQRPATDRRTSVS